MHCRLLEQGAYLVCSRDDPKLTVLDPCVHCEPVGDFGNPLNHPIIGSYIDASIDWNYFTLDCLAFSNFTQIKRMEG